MRQSRETGSLLAEVFLVLSVFILYFPAIREFIYDWSHDDNYSHGSLIPLISLYIIWRKRLKLRTIARRRNSLGLLVLLFGLAVNILGTAAAEWYSVRFSMIIVIAGMVFYLSGPEYLREVAFPIAFLVFAIPLPYAIFRTLTFPLQLFSTKATYTLLSFFGVSALRQGNIIHLSNYSLEVIEACSGLRSIITLSALAAIFSYFRVVGFLRKAFLFFMAVPIAIIANISRLLVTAFGAFLISPAVADGFLHEFSGILVFLVGLLLFVFTGNLLKWTGNEKSIGWSSA